MSSTPRFPLSWPTGWTRTRPRERLRAKFAKRSQGQYGSHLAELSVDQATWRLELELGRLQVEGEILSTNVALRLDGRPRSDQKEPADPGAAVYFTLLGKPQVLACDRWTRTADNIAAIAAHIEALRAIERYGVGTLAQAFSGYTALPPSTEDWWTVLAVDPHAGLDSIEEAFRKLAKLNHPDAGGTHDAMARLTRAREQARAARR